MTLDRRAVAAWCLYDWAMSAFNTVVGTFIFSVYFTSAVAESEVAGTAAWSRAMAISGLAIAVLSPMLGAIADQAGRRKPWLGMFTGICLVATVALWWVRPDPSNVLLALVGVAVATTAFELAGVFYNAMLPALSPPHMLGRISGWGWGVGYFGGLACLVLALFGFVQADGLFIGWVGTEAQANVRATSLLVAVWYAVFALPLFLFVPDAPATGLPLATAVRDGIGMFRRTLGYLRGEGNLVRWFIASALYRDGINTITAFGGIYAAGTFGMSFEEIVIFAIVLNVFAGTGAIGFAWLDDWFGAKRVILVSVFALVLTGAALLMVTEKLWFWVFALGLGIFFGPAQAAGRSFMARMAPPGMVTEMFGLYSLTGRAVGFVGPLALGFATEAFASQRAGMASVLVFFVIGFALMLTVREPAHPPLRPQVAH